MASFVDTMVVKMQTLKKELIPQVYYYKTNLHKSIFECGAGGLGPSGRRFEPCHSDHAECPYRI